MFLVYGFFLMGRDRFDEMVCGDLESAYAHMKVVLSSGTVCDGFQVSALEVGSKPVGVETYYVKDHTKVPTCMEDFYAASERFDGYNLDVYDYDAGEPDVEVDA